MPHAQTEGRLLHSLHTKPDNRDHAEEFMIVPFDSPNEFEYTGYFRIQSVRTKLGATYGTDPTPAGRFRVHQENIGSRVYFY